MKKLLEKLEILLLSITIIFVFSLFVFKKLYLNPVATNTFVLKIGHRGACGYEEENSFKSFKKALDLGVDAVELDVRLCKSGEIIVIHDEKVNRTSNGKGMVNNLHMYDLKNSTLNNGEKIPTLDQAFDLINRRALIFIELKELKVAKPVMKLIEEYVANKGWNYSDFVVMSFIKDSIVRASMLNKNVRLGLLFNDSKDLLDFSNNINSQQTIEYVGVNYKIISPDMIKNLHQKGFKVFVYTVNNINDVNEMKSLGVNGIVSDYPDRV